MTIKDLITSTPLDSLDNENPRSLIGFLSGAKSSSCDNDQIVWVFNRLEYIGNSADDSQGKLELKIRPYVAITIDKGKISINHLYNKTSFMLAIIGILGILIVGLLLKNLYLQQVKSQ